MQRCSCWPRLPSAVSRIACSVGGTTSTTGSSTTATSLQAGATTAAPLSTSLAPTTTTQAVTTSKATTATKSTVSSPSPESSLVLALLLLTPPKSSCTYYGAIGASAPTPQNPKGIHQGIDLVAPAGTSIKAVASGIVSNITETKTEYDGTVNTYANLLVKFDDHYVINYIFEPSKSIVVTIGQTVSSGDVLGTIANNRGQNLRGTKGTGTLDLGLLSTAQGSWSRVCFIPFTSPSFRHLLEVWFSRAYTATAEHPGPCVCHYHVP